MFKMAVLIGPTLCLITQDLKVKIESGVYACAIFGSNASLLLAELPCQ